MLRIDALASRELQAIILGLSRADATVRKHVRQGLKPLAQTEWQKSVREHAETRLDHRVLGDTARAFPSDRNVRLSAAGIGRKLTGGARPSEIYPGVEFGAEDRRSTYDATSVKGKRFSVTRNTTAQLPRRTGRGRVFYPAANQMIPRIASLWAQTVVRTFAEALEQKG